MSNRYSAFCHENGIIHEMTPPYSPQSNGIAERKNRTLSDLVNAMLEQQDYLRNGGIRLTTREQNLERCSSLTLASAFFAAGTKGPFSPGS